MKTKMVLFVVVVFLLSTSCIREKEQIQAPTSQFDSNSFTISHSMKGWELYSWPDGTGWKYSILIGTNRVKTYKEVTTNEIQVTGEDSLKKILDKFPKNEMISWFGSNWLKQTWNDDPQNISLPPEQITRIIQRFCDQKELQLQIIY